MTAVRFRKDYVTDQPHLHHHLHNLLNLVRVTSDNDVEIAGANVQNDDERGKRVGVMAEHEYIY